MPQRKQQEKQSDAERAQRRDLADPKREPTEAEQRRAEQVAAVEQERADIAKEQQGEASTLGDTPGVVNQDTGYQLADDLSPDESARRASAQAEGGGPWPPELAANRAATPLQPSNPAELYAQQAREAEQGVERVERPGGGVSTEKADD